MKDTILKKCPECGGDNLNFNRDIGELTCNSCGLVIKDEIIKIEKPLTSTEEGSVKPDGVGPAFTYRYADKGLFTNLGDWSDFKKIPKNKQYAFKRLKILQNRAKSSIERNLDVALNMIRIQISNLKLSNSIEEEACMIYTFAVYKGLIRGRPMEHTSAAAVYLAARSQDVPLTMNTISSKNSVFLTKRELGKAIRILMRGLKIKSKPQNPIDFIPQICSNSSLDQKVQSKAVELIEKADKITNMSGKSPVSLAAGAVYAGAILLGEKRNQYIIADAAKITEATLRARVKELTNILNIDLSNKKYSRKSKG